MQQKDKRKRIFAPHKKCEASILHFVPLPTLTRMNKYFESTQHHYMSLHFRLVALVSPHITAQFFRPLQGRTNPGRSHSRTRISLSTPADLVYGSFIKRFSVGQQLMCCPCRPVPATVPSSLLSPACLVHTCSRWMETKGNACGTLL